jgi:hypothetical protein
MVYDNINKKMISFVGYNIDYFGSTYIDNETWTYDLSINSWINKHPFVCPPARGGFAMAFDSDRGEAVLFGGGALTKSSIFYNDTWSYNLTTNTWTNLTPADSPPARWGHSMVYDSANKVMVLFGGNTSILNNETWTYDLGSNSWTKKNPATSPPARERHSMAYDRKNGETVLYSGVLGPSDYSENDTWTYNLTNNLWSNKTPKNAPPPRFDHAMAYDYLNCTIVLVGGESPGNYNWRADSWTYNLTANNWTLGTLNAPSERVYHDMAYDSDKGEMVLFGGWDGSVYDNRNQLYCYCGDTWTYNLSLNRWTLKSPLSSCKQIEPLFAYKEHGGGHIMAYDSRAGEMVLFGLQKGSVLLNITYTYNLTNNLWTEKKPANSPSARRGSAMVYNSRAGEMVLFGGQNDTKYSNKWLNDTWMYNLSTNTWTNKSPTNTPGRSEFISMVYLESTGEVLLLSYVNSMWSTWKYNLTNNDWVEMNSLTNPDFDEFSLSMVYDRYRNEVIAYGCNGYSVPQTWCFNLTTNDWTRIGTTTTPPYYLFYTVVYDDLTKEIMLFGGGDGSGPRNSDIWTFNRKTYSEAGNYTSPPIDTRGKASFGNISWTASVPQECRLKVQFRSGNSEDEMNITNFTGPDGTSNTSYANGQSINGMHNGSRWIQYRISMNTSLQFMTPLVESLQIRYNLLQTVDITSPNTYVNWTGSHGITWKVNDLDNDSFTFDIYLLNASGSRPLVLNYVSALMRYQWDTDTVPSGEYRIQIFAKDDNKTIPLVANFTSPVFTVWHPNRLPAAVLLGPEDGKLVNSSSVTLQWNGSDADEDAIYYYVFAASEEFYIDTLPDLLGVTTNTTFEFSNLTNGTTYFWSVLPFDGKENGSLPTCWRFTAHLPLPPPINHAPAVSLLSPENNTLVTSISVSLSWEGSDADHDPLTYFVFLSDSSFDADHLPLLVGWTNDTSFIASNLTNGATYFWTVIANDGKENGTGMAVWKFTVQVVVPPDTPRIKYYSPTGKKVSINPNILLTFDREMDGQSVFAAISFDPPVDIAGFQRFNNNFTFNLGKTLEFETTYKVMVSTSAKSSLGKNMFLPFKWNFTTLAQGEIDIEMPTVLLTDPPNGATNVDNRKNITIMFSEAMDRTATELSCSISPSVNGSWLWMNQKGFALQFHPGSGFADAKYSVTISSSARDESGNLLDGNGNGKPDGTADDFRFSFTVGIPQVVWPRLLSKSVEGSGVRLGAIITLTFDRAMNLSSVQKAFKMQPIMDGSWTTDTDGKILVFTPAQKFRPGTKYTITLSATAADIDGNHIERDEVWTFTTVSAGSPAETAFPLWLLPALVVLVVLGAAGYAYSKRGKASALPPVSPVGAAAVSAPEGFAVEEIFLMYNDGRLILHTTRRIQADMDADIFASMLTALQAFVKDSYRQEGGAELGSMEFGGNKILLEKGKYIIIAAVITGGEPSGFRDEMKAAVKNIESEFATVLPTWDGNTSLFSEAKRFLGRLGAYKLAEELPAEKPRADVSIKNEVEFYQGFVRLKVAVKNNMPTMIFGVVFKLLFDENALQLYSIEPVYDRKGDDIILGIIGPKEKKTLAFCLDPQICTESHLEGILSFKDAHGNLETLKMPRKLTSVVCPILFTDENINTAMLKRMAAEELDKKDSKVFTIPSNIAPQKAFEIGKAAVQHHDVRLVRELREERPLHLEAWYFGKAKGRPEKLIIRVRIIPEMNFLEFFSASDSVLMLTGMLAELKSDLNKELENQKMPGSMKQVTSRDDIDALATIRSLLDKAAESESAAGETEIRS